MTDTASFDQGYAAGVGAAQLRQAALSQACHDAKGGWPIEDVVARAAAYYAFLTDSAPKQEAPTTFCVGPEGVTSFKG